MESGKALGRYKDQTREQLNGVTYTLPHLSRYMAHKLVLIAQGVPANRPLTILDPAIGDGRLVVDLLRELPRWPRHGVHVTGFDIDGEALDVAYDKIHAQAPRAEITLREEDFLRYTLEQRFALATKDWIIANPPYVRAASLDEAQAKMVANLFGIEGSADLYIAFMLSMIQYMHGRSVLCVLSSNKYLVTRSGTTLRRQLRQRTHVRNVLDLGDTREFEVAVTPAILTATGLSTAPSEPSMSTLYRTRQPSEHKVANSIEALRHTGAVALESKAGRLINVQHGSLKWGEDPGSTWRLSTREIESWLDAVESCAGARFADVLEFRPSCWTGLDPAFFSDWSAREPECLHAIHTSEIARRFRAFEEHAPLVLYPYVNNRLINLDEYPVTARHLHVHHPELIRRGIDPWYAFAQPCFPALQERPKLVWRDIAFMPVAWVENEGALVHAANFWAHAVEARYLWLACAVLNSGIALRWFELLNRQDLITSGAMRWRWRYVAKLPLPDPDGINARDIAALAERVWQATPSRGADALARELDERVWHAFNLPYEETPAGPSLALSEPPRVMAWDEQEPEEAPRSHRRSRTRRTARRSRRSAQAPS